MANYELPLYQVVKPPPPHYSSHITPHYDLTVEPNMNNYHLDLKLAMEEMSALESSPDHTRDVEAKPLPPPVTFMNTVDGKRLRRPVWGVWAFFALVIGLICLSFLLPALIMYFSSPHRSMGK
jgi:hypothetical protein